MKKKDISAEEFLNIAPNPDEEKMLYVRVLSSDGSKVKVNIPLEFIKIMGRIGKNAYWRA